MEFDWDDSKADSNFRKHGVRFSQAVTIWLDDLSLEMLDPEHSETEERWIRIGMSREANVLVVVYVEKIEGERTRIISARKAKRNEEKQYHTR